MALTKERLVLALAELHEEELDGVETYEALIAEVSKIHPRDFVLKDLLNDLYKIVADEEIHADVLKRYHELLTQRL